MPGDWSPRPAPGAVVAFDIADEPDQSVVVSTLRVDGAGDLRELAVRTFARQRSIHPGAEIRSQRTGRFAERLTYLREVAIPGGDDRVTAQLHALFAVAGPEGRGWTDVMSVVASCPDGDLATLGPATIELVASFRPVGDR